MHLLTFITQEMCDSVTINLLFTWYETLKIQSSFFLYQIMFIYINTEALALIQECLSWFFFQYSFIIGHYKVLEKNLLIWVFWLIGLWLKLGFIIFNNFNTNGHKIIYKRSIGIVLVIYHCININTKLRGLKK